MGSEPQKLLFPPPLLRIGDKGVSTRSANTSSLVPSPSVLSFSLSFRLVRPSALQVPLILIRRDRCAKETSDRGREEGTKEGRGGGEKRVLLNTNATGFAPCYSNRRRRRLLSIEPPQQLGGSPRVCRPRAVQIHSEKELPRTGYLSSVLVLRRLARNFWRTKWRTNHHWFHASSVTPSYSFVLSSSSPTWNMCEGVPVLLRSSVPPSN